MSAFTFYVNYGIILLLRLLPLLKLHGVVTPERWVLLKMSTLKNRVFWFYREIVCLQACVTDVVDILKSNDSIEQVKIHLQKKKKQIPKLTTFSHEEDKVSFLITQFILEDISIEEAKVRAKTLLDELNEATACFKPEKLLFLDEQPT